MKTRRILAGVVGATMALTLAGAAFATGGQPLDNPTLPVNAADASHDGCTGVSLDPGQVLWHFVLTTPSNTSGHMNATFSNVSDSVSNLADDGQGSTTLHWTIINNSTTLDSAATTDVTGGNFNLSHTCVGAQETSTPNVTPSPTPTLPNETPTPTLPQTSTIDQSNTGGPGTSLTLVFALILAIAGGLVAYAMRPRRVTNR